MVKTRTWIILFAALLLIAVAATVGIFWGGTGGGTVANIYQDGVCIHSVDLAAVTEPYEFTVSCEAGKNVIRVEQGRIRVSDADCPDRVCVDSGWLSDSSAPIVCLPHRLVIRIEKRASDRGVDAVAR